VRDPEVHRRVLLEMLAFVLDEGYQIKGLARSPVLGPKGNVEFLLWLAYPGSGTPSESPVEELVSKVLDIE
jgi:23S rRNA (cytidine1920-2'-O)/16S rRNA (cytidine1409-2'-O)-methyltransferase